MAPCRARHQRLCRRQSRPRSRGPLSRRARRVVVARRRRPRVPHAPCRASAATRSYLSRRSLAHRRVLPRKSVRRRGPGQVRTLPSMRRTRQQRLPRRRHSVSSKLFEARGRIHRSRRSPPRAPPAETPLRPPHRPHRLRLPQTGETAATPSGSNARKRTRTRKERGRR